MASKEYITLDQRHSRKEQPTQTGHLLAATISTENYRRRRHPPAQSSSALTPCPCPTKPHSQGIRLLHSPSTKSGPLPAHQIVMPWTDSGSALLNKQQNHPTFLLRFLLILCGLDTPVNWNRHCDRKFPIPANTPAASLVPFSFSLSPICQVEVYIKDWR